MDDKYHFPNICDLLDERGKCQFVTTLDFTPGFQQDAVYPYDYQKTYFKVENDHFEYVRMYQCLGMLHQQFKN